jgi:hypothetical protein
MWIGKLRDSQAVEIKIAISDLSSDLLPSGLTVSDTLFWCESPVPSDLAKMP